MLPSLRTTAALSVVMFALANMNEAAAAFLLPDLEQALVGSDVATPPVEGEGPQRPPEPEVPQEPGQAYFSHTSSPGTWGGTSTSPTSSASGVAALWQPVERQDRAILVGYVRRESRAFLPVPFLDGVFRPPRVVG